ncbi:hypothetical protein [Nocardia higoensis]|uniref:hypothetical protein n=1 Tax=Nocardia higoensis TaxID=228599 RepID=UPI0002EB0798|nr:hypothetical protein [Nocardia higoensis]
MEALIYGYLRDDLAEGHREEIEAKMSSLAREEGLCFAATFHEETGGDGAAFVELTQELRRADAHHVVVPSLDHLAGQTIPRDILIAKLAQDAAARVWTIEDAPHTADGCEPVAGAPGGSDALPSGYRTDRTESTPAE